MKTITVKADTRLKDLKVGDLVMTAELMKVRHIRNRQYIAVTSVIPQCQTCGRNCAHQWIKHTGWGQQGVVKVLERDGSI